MTQPDPHLSGTLPSGQDDDDVPLYLGLEMRGYRAWIADYDGDTPVLRPIYRGRTTPWLVGANNAACYVSPDGWGSDVPTTTHPDAPVPARNCGCGYWAYVTPDGYSREMLEQDPYASSLVTGVVLGSGRIELTEDGFRAQKAELVALGPPRRIHEAMQPTGHADTEQWRLNHLAYYKTRIEHRGHCPCVWCRDERGAQTPTLAELAVQYRVPYYSTYQEMCEEWTPTHQPRPMPTWQSFSFSGFAPILPAAVAPGMAAMQMMVNSVLAQGFSRVNPAYRGRLRRGYPPQPAFTGSMGEALSGWWNWALTKRISV